MRRLWADVENELGWRLPEALKTYFAKVGFVDEWRRVEHDEKQRQFVVSQFVLHAQEWLKSLSGNRQVVEIKAPTPGDGRWALTKELLAELDEDAEWEHIRVYVENESANMGQVVEAVSPQRIVISADHRIALETLINFLRKAWPKLHRDGQLRRTSPIKRRGVELLRHVCLKSDPDQSWETRYSSWNASVGTNWRFKDRGRFITAFHTAEQQLTGSRSGLRLFYDGKARRRFEARKFIKDWDATREFLGAFLNRPKFRSSAQYIEWLANLPRYGG